MKIGFVVIIVWMCSVSFAQSKFNQHQEITSKDILVGAERTNLYFPFIKGKKIAVVANQTSMIKHVHLVDSLLGAGIQVVKIFTPEHGFRGKAEAGELVKNGIDAKTQLPIVSLYGDRKKPLPDDFKNVDIVIFDIQDVGARFYTYISTLHYMMEACAENKKKLIVLDRPNPNGFYVDGPVLKNDCKSFVGMHPVPIVHGMTIAEYAQMINGEGWLKDSVKCNLEVVTVDSYNHSLLYQLPIPPSPNLKTMSAVYLYPSLCLFEGTVVSVGRGTDKPFCMIGHPQLAIKDANVKFIPKRIPGEANKPLYEGQETMGYDLYDFGNVFMKNSGEIYLYFLIGMYQNLSDKENFFNPFFDKLAGNIVLRQQIELGLNPELIRDSWKDDLNLFKEIRKKYLLYPDFE